MPGITRFIIFFVLISILYKEVSEVLKDNEVPVLPLNQWWGDKDEPTDWTAYLANTSKVVTNKLFYTDKTINELKVKLNRTRHLTEPLEGVSFEYGMNGKVLKEIIEYWRDDYLPRWRERELFLWQFNHLTTEIQGLRLHFLHLMLYDTNTVNKHHYLVLLLHGWPGSIRELYSIIHKLVQTDLDKNNKYIFDIIAPSLPGFAWSKLSNKCLLAEVELKTLIDFVFKFLQS